MTQLEKIMCEELTLSLQSICTRHIEEIRKESVPAATPLVVLNCVLAIQVVGMEIPDDMAVEAFQSCLRSMRKHMKSGTSWSHVVEPTVPS